MGRLTGGQSWQPILAAAAFQLLEPPGNSGTLNNAVTPEHVAPIVQFLGVPLNVYDVNVSVGGSYYTGSADTVLSIFDPQ